MVSLKDLERMATGGHWDSTQLPQIARELIAARALIVFLEEAAENFGDIRLGADTEGLMLNALVMYQLERDAAREA